MSVKTGSKQWSPSGLKQGLPMCQATTVPYSYSSNLNAMWYENCRNVDLTRTNLAYTWFAEIYNANIWFRWLGWHFNKRMLEDLLHKSICILFRFLRLCRDPQQSWTRTKCWKTTVTFNLSVKTTTLSTHSTTSVEVPSSKVLNPELLAVNRCFCKCWAAPRCVKVCKPLGYCSFQTHSYVSSQVAYFE